MKQVLVGLTHVLVGSTVVLAIVQVFIGIAVFGFSVSVQCSGTSVTVTADGQQIETRFNCDRHPEEALLGLVIAGGGGLVAAAPTIARKRPLLGAAGVLLGAAPTLVLMNVSGIGLLLPPVLMLFGLPAVLAASRATQSPAT